MKLYARKSMIALGTAAALSLSMVTAPAMAADDGAASPDAGQSQPAAQPDSGSQQGGEGAAEGTDGDGGHAAGSPAESGTTMQAPTAGSPSTTTSGESPTTNTTAAKQSQSDSKPAEKGDNKYSQLHTEVSNDLNSLEHRIATLKSAIMERSAKATEAKDPAAQQKLASAENYLATAKSDYASIKDQFDHVQKTGTQDDPDYGTLKGLQSSIRNIQSTLNNAENDYRAANPVSCEDGKATNDDSGSGGSFGSLFESFGSSGRMSVVKDGKKTCVSKAEYYSEKLTKIVAILGTVFTLITTMTKISETIQKQAMPRP